MKPELLEVLSKLLPGVRFTTDHASNAVYAQYDGEWQDLSEPGMYLDHLCGEAERAVLAKEGIAWVETVLFADGSSRAFIGKEGFATAAHSMVNGCGGTKLTAILEAVKKME